MRAVRCFQPLLLLPLFAAAAVVPGDTLFTSMAIGERSFLVDGTRVRIQTICTASIPGTCMSYVAPTDSVSVLAGSGPVGSQPYFLTQHQTCMFPSPGCWFSRAEFVDSLAWKIKGRNGDWALGFDSVATGYRARWAPIRAGWPFVKWFDTLTAPPSMRLGVDSVVEAPLFRCMDTVKGCTVDSVWLRTFHGTFGNFVARAGLGLRHHDGNTSFWKGTGDDSGHSSVAGYAAPLSVTGSLLAQTPTRSHDMVADAWISWALNKGRTPMDTIWARSGALTFRERAKATWHFRINGRIDSFVVAALVPQVGESVLRTNSTARPGGGGTAVDIQGRPLHLDDALPPGRHLVESQGRPRVVIVGP